MTLLGSFPPGEVESAATAVSADGTTIVGVSKSQAFRWTTATGMVPLGDLPGGSSSSQANAVSADGSVIVGYSGSTFAGSEVFRWENGQMVGLGLPGVPFGVSADGSVIVGVVGLPGVVAPFIWDPIHGGRNLVAVLLFDYGLDLTGWTLTSARGVSADGRSIIGDGRNPSGQQEAWIAIIPEPSTAVLLAGGLGLLAASRRQPWAEPRLLLPRLTR